MTDDGKKITIPLEDQGAITEQDVLESRKELAAHADLKLELAEILKHPRAVDIAVHVRALVDQGIAPIVVAKTLMIGDRFGGLVYQLAAPGIALGAHERAAERLQLVVLRDVPDAVAATMLAAGATWLAEQFKIERSILREWVRDLTRRTFPSTFQCPGALDYVDGRHVASRAWLLDAIDHARLPAHAPLEYSRFKP